MIIAEMQTKIATLFLSVEASDADGKFRYTCRWFFRKDGPRRREVLVYRREDMATSAGFDPS